MFCPNCNSDAIFGPDTPNRRQAIMRCGDCSRRFDAIELYGLVQDRSQQRQAA